MKLFERLGTHRRKLVPALVVLVGLVAALIFRQQLHWWFTGEPTTSGVPADARKAEAGPFALEAALVPDPAREKGNTLRLRVEDTDSQPVKGAKVRVTYRMPAMGSMQEMRGKADVSEQAGGVYDARFDLPMGGSWMLEVTVEKGERSGEVTFNTTVGTPGLTVTGEQKSGAAAHAAMKHPGVPELPEHEFDDSELARLREAFATYEAVRTRLAHDSTEGLPVYAEAMHKALGEVARDKQKLPEPLRQTLGHAAQAAEALGKAGDAEAARAAFAGLSMNLMALAASDKRLSEGLHVFRCPMAKGFQKWFQPSSDLENPYMGENMPTCGESSEWSDRGQETSAPGAQGHDHGQAAEGDIAYYTCPMHPSVKQQSPGQCPICGMDLTPVTKQEVQTGIIFVDEIRRQRIGVRTAKVINKKMEVRIRAVGEVKVDETRLADVNLRMSGWVQRLLVNETGQRVARGQTLFALYSPELYAAQLEHLAAVRRLKEGTSEMLAGLAKASRQRLRLLGMTQAQIEALEKRGEASENVPISAPASGYVIEKNVVEGARVEAGMLVYRIADLSRIWIDAEVYESDLPHVKKGQAVTVRLPYVPDKSYQGKVDFIYPTLQNKTRTGRVRVVLKNPDLELKPDMYANVELSVELGERLTIPDSAVVYTGPRRLVFVDLGAGRLRPKAVELGVHAEGVYEVVGGLQAGDVVVTSGNFLIAAESRLRSATNYWEGSNAAE